MDITVTRAADDRLAWDLTDLLGRPVGRITGAGQQFVIQPDERVCSAMDSVRWGPHPSLDAALAAIEKHSPFVCRRAPEED
jgi:hypothetical protein